MECPFLRIRKINLLEGLDLVCLKKLLLLIHNITVILLNGNKKPKNERAKRGFLVVFL